MIDRATGRIRLDDVAFDAALTKTSFLKGRTVDGRAVGKAGWCCSIERPLNGRPWRLSPFFEGEVLQSVGMGYAHTGGPAADWEGNERSNLTEYEALLRTWLGKYPDTFPWGRVEAYFDEKGVGSGICVYYRERST